MSFRKLWNEKNAQISLSIVSLAIVAVAFFGGVTIVNKNKQLITDYDETVQKAQQRSHGQNDNIVVELMIKDWQGLGRTMASNDATIAFVMKLAGFVLVSINLINLYRLIKKKGR